MSVAALAPLAAGALAAGALAVLILWRSTRREQAHAEHVNAAMATALAELRTSQRALLTEQFDDIVDRNWTIPDLIVIDLILKADRAADQ